MLTPMIDQKPDHFDLPSATTDCPWLYARSPVERYDLWQPEQAGKWCIFCTSDDIDTAWERVRTAVLNGELPAAKTSTSLTSYGRYQGCFVICVYNADWKDDAAIDRSREVLRRLGWVQELGYKRDIETIRGVYCRPDEWYRRG